MTDFAARSTRNKWFSPLTPVSKKSDLPSSDHFNATGIRSRTFAASVDGARTGEGEMKRRGGEREESNIWGEF